MSKANCGSLSGPLGETPEHLWQPWAYRKQCTDADSVAAFKDTHPNCTRDQVLQAIHHNNSRQEFRPLLGEYIDLAKAEPLHCTSNAWGAIFDLALLEEHNRTKLPSRIKFLNEIPHDCVLVQFVHALKAKVGAHHLHKKTGQTS